MNTRQKFVFLIGALVLGVSGIALATNPSSFYADNFSAPINPEQYLSTAQRLGMDMTEEDEGYKRVAERYNDYINGN